MFQVVVEVCGRAALVVLLMAGSFCIIDISYIDIDIYYIEYTDGGSHFYERAPKVSASPSCLANHAESLAIDVSLCVSDANRGGVRRV